MLANVIPWKVIFLTRFVFDVPAMSRSFSTTGASTSALVMSSPERG